MKTSKIEQELNELLKLKGKKGEKRPDLLARTLKAVTDLTDEAFDNMSKPAQDWANAASKAKDAQDELPDFPDTNTDAESAEETKTMKTEKKAAAPAKGAKKEAEAKPAKEKKAAAPKEKKGPGKIHKMKLLILKNLEVTTEDLGAKLKAAGIEVSDSTVTTVRSDFLSSIRVLQAAGKLKEDLIPD